VKRNCPLKTALRIIFCSLLTMVLSACNNFSMPLKEILAYNLAVVPVESWNELEDVINNAPDNTEVAFTVIQDLTVGSPITIPANKHIRIAAYSGRTMVLRRPGPGTYSNPLFRVMGSLTLGDAKHGGLLVLDGGAVWSGNPRTNISGINAGAPLVRVSGGSLTLEAGAVLRNNDATGMSVGGVSVENYGTFIMKGGEISDNAATNGGGVGTDNNSAFIMKGGKISGNTATVSGGGVASSNGALEGGEISGNTATEGGGVYVSGAFIMKGGKISGNTANSNGGGVYAGNGGLTMEGGEISGNTAVNQGGGVWAGFGDFTMEGGEISGNNAGDGGGLWVGYGAAVTIAGGKISGNTANSGGGGGLCLAGTSTIACTLNGGEITANSAGSYGAVYVSATTVNYSGGWSSIDKRNQNKTWIHANGAEPSTSSGFTPES
jgi:hypothetical protein